MPSLKTLVPIEDLYKIDGKAEHVEGEIMPMSPTGEAPNYSAGEIFVSLREYGLRTGKGRAVTDNIAFQVDLPHRKSFSPDTAFHDLPRSGMKFLKGAPLFAVEIGSENDYGREAERRIKAKRDDYFAAGTLVVWDVDLLSVDVVMVYRSDNPDRPTVYRRGDVAEAEPALPGWRMPVDALFL